MYNCTIGRYVQLSKKEESNRRILMITKVSQVGWMRETAWFLLKSVFLSGSFSDLS